jgi:hypothetical protein
VHLPESFPGLLPSSYHQALVLPPCRHQAAKLLRRDVQLVLQHSTARHSTAQQAGVCKTQLASRQTNICKQTNKRTNQQTNKPTSKQEQHITVLKSCRDTHHNSGQQVMDRASRCVSLQLLPLKGTWAGQQLQAHDFTQQLGTQLSHHGGELALQVGRQSRIPLGGVHVYHVLIISDIVLCEWERQQGLEHIISGSDSRMSAP